MSFYVDLQRRFRDLTKAELEDPEFLASLNDRKFVGPTDWSQLLKCRRVLLLAEAGSGKTTEMREQAKRLTSEGKYAFFVALESLDRGPLVDVLSAVEERSLNAWKADPGAAAWFFLDAVDELKLTAGSLDRALQRFSKVVDGQLHRVHVIISCRPNDWRSTFDMATLKTRFPLPAKRPNPIVSADEAFIRALRSERGESLKDLNKQEDDPTETEIVRTVMLLPMSSRQIRLFAERCGVHDASAFMAEIAREDAWTFARRPLDLSELITIWLGSGRLGTRVEQHEANIRAKLKDDPNRPDHGVLTNDQYRLGAERLALALALTRTRTIRSPEQALELERGTGVLDPATVLRDWTERERQALLRSGLFDPATYGRIRFHHRSVQEFLAARRLKALFDRGMPRKTSCRLLFGERYGEKVVLPSMRSIAAGLAIWDDAVQRELSSREPEVLLSLGDPASLSLGARAELLRAFANAYGTGGHRGFNIPLYEIRQIAHPDLAPTIRELWGNGPFNSDVRELLLELIWNGPVDSCSDLTQAVALDVNSNEYHRVVAVRALLASGRTAVVREIVKAMVTDPGSWPDKTIFYLAPDLFPKNLTLDELILLMKRTGEPQRTTTGFGWASSQIVESMDPNSDLAAAFRDKVAGLILRGRKENLDPHHLSSRFGHLAPALAMLCERQLASLRDQADPALIRSCVIASRFGEKGSAFGEELTELAAKFQSPGAPRAAVFPAELAFIDEVAPGMDDWGRLYHTEYNSLIGRLTEVDRAWLEAAVADERLPLRRPVFLHALLDLWRQRGAIANELDAIRALIREDSVLKGILAERTAAPKRSHEDEMMERADRRRQIADTIREKRRLQKWKKWRQELMAYPDKAFAPDKRSFTVANFHRWLSAFGRPNAYYDVWNQDALTKAFGADIANRAAEAFKAFWRATPPTLWSQRLPEERNSIPVDWLYGLCGLSAEASTPGWELSLNPDEVRIAVAYATVDLNGLAPFISELTASRPEVVDSVLGSELRHQLSMGGDHSHLPLLQDLSQAKDSLKRLSAPRLLEALLEWPANFPAETRARWADHLEYVLRILQEIDGQANRRTVADVCAGRFETDRNGPLALVWLRGLFRFDSQRGAQALTAGLTAENDPVIRAHAMKAFASLFSDGGAVIFNIENPDERARILGSLVRSAYAFIRPEDDEVHEGVYTPNTRDRAEEARSVLLSALLETPGPEACRVILELAADPNFEHFPDRLRLLARERAAKDAEFPAFGAEDIIDLENRCEIPPRDRDGLFLVMMDRLDDLAHDLSDSDFTDRRTLKEISDESEMQRTLAWRIKTKANGAFLVTREEEVADLKRTDIRLSALRCNQKAVIEIKLADERYSLADLESALFNQLVLRYLRHETCKAGVLLLTYNGKKKRWKSPVDRNYLNFVGVVDYLNEKAKALEINNQYTIRLAVFGLDLTDPLLSSSRREHS